MMRVWPLVLILSLVSAGCTVNEVIVAEESELVVSQAPVEESQLLDVGIVEFASGLDEDNDPRETGVYEEIRLAEARSFEFDRLLVQWNRVFCSSPGKIAGR